MVSKQDNKVITNTVKSDPGADQSSNVSLSSVLGDSGLQAEIIEPFETMLEQQIKIVGCDLRDGDYGEYVVIFYESSDGQILGLSCGGKVVVRKIKRLLTLDAFPVFATPKQVKRYYDII